MTAKGLSKYSVDIIALQFSTKAKSLYAFIVEGDRGSGGMPIIQIQPTFEAYRAAQQELLQYVARGLKLMQADWKMVVETPGETALYWRGSVNDLVTDVAPLLTRAQRELFAVQLLEWRQDG